MGKHCPSAEAHCRNEVCVQNVVVSISDRVLFEQFEVHVSYSTGIIKFKYVTAVVVTRVVVVVGSVEDTPLEWRDSLSSIFL